MLRIKLATPEIELEVIAVDYAKRNAKITVGFRRYTRKEAMWLLNFLSEDAEEGKDKLLLSKHIGKDKLNVLRTSTEEDILRQSILYMSGLEVELDSGFVTLDTRELPETITEKELLDAYLNDTTFYSAIASTFLKALSTYDYEAAKRKNL